MAIDKAVDSAALESNLTSVADAIRAKTGGSDPLAFPSGMVDAIAGIASGGGGATIYSGNFTPAENLTSIDIALEIEPKNFVFWKNSETAGYGARTAYGLWLIENANVAHIGSNSNGSTAISGVSVETYEEYLDLLNGSTYPTSYFTYANGTLTLTTKASGAGGGYLVPEQYNWMAW